MKSHFSPNNKFALACAVAGASTMMMEGNCFAGGLVAADYATNPIYAGGWSAGQNGGYGFGPWSFDGTADTNGNPSVQQAISSSSAIGTAWTLYNSTSVPPGGPGISNAGRSITEPGGLQPGQTLEAVIQNPTAYHFYRGFDFLCLNGTDNDPAGDGTSAIRVDVFDYFGADWSIIDGDGSTDTLLDSSTTTAGGMKLDLTLTSTNNYLVTLTPLGNPAAAYSQTGTLTTNLPINWVNFRLYLGPNSGPNDPVNDLEISSMTISGPPPFALNIQKVGTNVILTWPTNYPTAFVESTFNLGAAAVWSTNLIMPIIVIDQNVVTNPITGTQQYYRLQQ